MQCLDWIKNEIIANDLLCRQYAQRVAGAHSKRQLFDMLCDANGVSFLPEMSAKGHATPYDLLIKDFGQYLNGRYKAEIKGQASDSVGYTSAIYCRCPRVDKITVDTTLACFLDCDSTVRIPPYNVARLCVDANSKIRIDCPRNAVVTVEYWCDDRNIEIVNGDGKIKMRKKGK